MGFILSLVLIGGLLAFNLFAADTMMRMRTDIQIIRKTLAGMEKERAVPSTAPPPSTKEAEKTAAKSKKK